MACNLALTITTAEVSDENLRKLVTPEVAKQLADATTRGQGYTVAQQGDTITVRQGGYYGVTVTIKDGKVSGRSYDNSERELVGVLGSALNAAANALYQKQIADQIQRQTGQQAVIQRGLNVQVGEQIRQATVFSVKW